MRSVRIGAGQGFYGDTPDGAVAVAERGQVSYVCCDALAELTMAILQRDRLRDPGGGFARDLPDFLRALLPLARDQGIRIITNAGGMNPHGAAAAARGVAADLGMDGLRVATVTGDDITSRIDELRDRGADLRNMDTGASIAAVRERVAFGVAYLGARPIVEALELGADVVVTGRVADASLFVAPMVHELGWDWKDWDRLATGVVVGHMMECSGQATGGADSVRAPRSVLRLDCSFHGHQRSRRRDPAPPRPQAIQGGVPANGEPAGGANQLRRAGLHDDPRAAQRRRPPRRLRAPGILRTLPGRLSEHRGRPRRPAGGGAGIARC